MMTRKQSLLEIKNKTTGTFILLFLIFIYLSCALAGCGNKSSETKASSTEKTTATSAGSSSSELSETTEKQITESSGTQLQGELVISLNYKHVDDNASNQYAVWIEDSNGQFIITLFVTSFTADGGWKDRPESLSVWVEKSGIGSGSAQAVDTYSGATPQSGEQSYVWDCKDANGQAVPAGEYHFFVDATVYWENAVLYEGIIELGAGEVTAQAEATYSTDAAKTSDMITGVEAVFRP